MDEISLKAQKYSKLSVEEQGSFIEEVSHEPSMILDLLISSSDSKFQEDVLRHNIKKLKLTLSDDKIVGKLFRQEIFTALLFQKSSVLLSIDQIKFHFEGFHDQFTSVILETIHHFIGRESVGSLSTDGRYFSKDQKFENVKISEGLDSHIQIDPIDAEISISFFFGSKLVSYEIHPAKEMVVMKNSAISRATQAFEVLGVSNAALFGGAPEDQRLA